MWIGDGRFKAPHALTVDAAGNLYVADSRMKGLGGEDYEQGSRRIYVFSPEGKLLRTIGKEGGARDGRFEAERLGDIAAVCIGPDGQSLWVQDVATGFPRTSRWSLDGKLQRQWFAPHLDLWPDAINPGRPNELIEACGAFCDNPGISAWEIDLAKKTWRPSWHYDSTWADMYQEDVYMSHEHCGPLKGKRWPVFHYGRFAPLVVHGGRTYAMNAFGQRRRGDLCPCPGRKAPPRGDGPVTIARRRRNGKIESLLRSGAEQLDHLGRPQRRWADVTWTKSFSRRTPPVLGGQRPHLRRLAGRAIERTHEASSPARAALFASSTACFRCRKSSPTGRPSTTGANCATRRPCRRPTRGGDGWKTVREYMLHPARGNRGGVLLARGSGVRGEVNLPGIDGDGWWASRNWRTNWCGSKADGPAAVGRRDPRPARAAPGQMYYPASLSGVDGDFLFVLNTMGMVWVWHKDGLYVGRLYHDTGMGQADDQAIYGEVQGSTIYHDPHTDKLYSLLWRHWPRDP